MRLAIFDLDNTLLAGDSEHQWIEFLADRGVIDGDLFRRRNDEFLAAYDAGTLDIHAYLRFALQSLADTPLDTLEPLRATFVEERIRPMIAPGAPDLLHEHRERGDHLLIITATNHFVAAPIAELLGVDTLIATDPEMRAGVYTGEVVGTPCFREGKILRLQEWMDGRPADLGQASFYSDSNNDLPLLERVARPVAVDPDPILAHEAARRNWSVISLRDTAQR